jgi:hypothetical protein
MPKWRPDGWNNLYDSQEPAWYDAMSSEHSDAFESGADAMLEALRAIGREGNIPVFGGVLVFIPDDKEDQDAR